MQIVIDIPRKVYNALKHIDFDASLVVNEMRNSIANGTPLPKGHGRLIDADELYLDIQTDEKMRLGEHLEWVKERFDRAPTIIKADKERGLLCQNRRKKKLSTLSKKRN